MSGAVTAVPLLKEKNVHNIYCVQKQIGLLFYPQCSQNRWVKQWLADIGVDISIPARGKIFPTVNGVSLDTAFHFFYLSIGIVVALFVRL